MTRGSQQPQAHRTKEKTQEGNKGNVRSVFSHSLILFPKSCLSLPILHTLPWLCPHPSPDLVLILAGTLARDKLQLQQRFRQETIHPGTKSKWQCRKKLGAHAWSALLGIGDSHPSCC